MYWEWDELVLIGNRCLSSSSSCNGGVSISSKVDDGLVKKPRFVVMSQFCLYLKIIILSSRIQKILFGF